MRFILAILAALFVSPASATVMQSGTVTPTHMACWTTNGIIQDCGTAVSSFLTTLGVTASGSALCQSSALPTAGAYNQLCFSTTSTSGGFTWTSYNGATGVPSMTINGTVYPFPFSAPGGIVGPGSSTIGCAAPWANTSGTLLGNSCALSISGSTVTLNNSLMIGTAPDILTQGPATPVVNSTMASDWTWGTSATVTNSLSEGGLWPGAKVYNGLIFARSFNSSNNSTLAAQGPNNTAFFYAENDGTNNTVQPFLSDVNCEASNTYCSGGNFVVRSNGGSLTGLSLNGPEIDIEPASGDALSASIGLPINCFNTQCGTVIQVGGVGGGTWTNGLIFSANVAGTGLGGQAGVTMASLVNCANATFSGGACLVVTTASFSGAVSFSGLTTFANNKLLLYGSSTGYTTLSSANAGASNYTATFPAATDTIAELTQTQTLTNKTIAFASNTLTGVAPLASPTFTGTFNVNGISGAGSASKYVCVDSSGNMLTQSGAC